MILSLRRVCAILVVLLTLTPVLGSAAETVQERPVAWLALRSYQRLEQRLREISTMAKAPGLADMLLGLVQLQLAGLGGLDRQRPIGLVVPTVSLADKPPMAVVLPYTDRDAILHTLQGFFPQSIVEDNERLSLQGGPIPAFGRLDAQASVLIVSTSPEVAQGFDVSLPADLFGAQENGPDLVLRVDVEAVKQQLDVAWKAMLAGLEQAWQAALQKAAEDQAMSPADKAAMTAYVTMTQRGLRQFLDDFSLGESRLTLASTGWVFDLETKMRPGSVSAAFLNAQAGHTSRAAQLFAPSANTFLRLVYNVRMTDSLRQETMALFPALRQMLEARLAALPDLTPEQRTAGTQAIATYLSLLEQWYSQKELEAAAEMRVQDKSFALTSWLPFVDSRRALSAILDVVEKIPLLMGDAVIKVTRDIGQYQGTALHRIELPKNKAPEFPTTAFVAAQGNWLAFHLGTSPEPLQTLLDRARNLSSQAPTQTDAVVHTELFLAPMLQLGMSKGQMGSQNPMSQALIEKLQQGPNEPFRIDLLTRQDAATLRSTFPGALVQSVAELMGQQIMQQLRGGGEKQGSGGKSKQ